MLVCNNASSTVIAPTFLQSVLRRILNVQDLPTRLQLSHLIHLLPYCQHIDRLPVEPLETEGWWSCSRCDEIRSYFQLM